jgi:VanZ family protein
MIPPWLRLLARWIPALLWMAVIYYWSSQSSTPSPGWLVSKLAHVGEYSVLAALLAFALARSRRWMLLAWLLATLYAGSDELHQAFTPQRHPMLSDVALDSAAAILGLQVSRTLRFRWSWASSLARGGRR